jgi:predicted permease
MRPLLSLRLAVRGLRRDLPTSLAAIGMLALGMAAPAVFFSLLWGGGLRHLPVPEGERVVRVDVMQPREAGAYVPVQLGDLPSLRDAGGLDGLEAFSTRLLTISSRATGATQVSAASMTAGTWDLLRVAPALGRIPSGAEAATALILSHELWTTAFEGRPDVLGESVTLDGDPGEIVAVMPEGFGFPLKQSAWTLLDPVGESTEPVELVGRLTDASGTEQAAALRLQAAWAAGDVAREPAHRDGRVRVAGFTRHRGESGEGVAFLGLVLVGLCLLIIACMNATNLLLVRAAGRIRVLGVQAALGAGRLQLASQLWAEAAILATGGGLVGLLIAHGVVDHIQRSMGPENFGYYWMRVAVDGPVVLFTAILVLGTAVAAGSVPVVRVLRSDVRGILAGGDAGWGGPSSFRGWSWGRVFVTGQLALSCGALVAAGLTGRAMNTARTFGGDLPGDEILIGRLGLDVPSLPGVEERRAALPVLESSLEALPETVGSALALGAPGFGEVYTPVERGGERVGDDQGRPVGALANGVTPGYFDLFGIETLRGRGLEAADGGSEERVAVVDEDFVARFLPDGPVIGAAVELPELGGRHRVVGVVSSLDLGGGQGLRSERIYVPLAQTGRTDVTVLLRGSVDSDFTRALRREVAAWNPEVPIQGVRTLDDAWDFMTRAQSNLSLLAVGGGLGGLLVAAVGLYALLAFRVRRARRELGVRLALGADGTRLARSVLQDAMGQLLPAVGVGLALAWVAAPALGAFLLGGDPRSPEVFGAVALAFLCTGGLAALVPALRARSVEPAEVLRSES